MLMLRVNVNADLSDVGSALLCFLIVMVFIHRHLLTAGIQGGAGCRRPANNQKL